MSEDTKIFLWLVVGALLVLGGGYVATTQGVCFGFAICCVAVIPGLKILDICWK